MSLMISKFLKYQNIHVLHVKSVFLMLVANAFCFSVVGQSKENSIVDSLISCDSTIIERITIEMDVLIETPIRIQNTVVDSSSFTLIGGRKYYRRKSISSPAQLNSLLCELNLEDKLCSYMGYAYIIDYLIDQGFDVDFDYTVTTVYDEKISSYVNIRKTEDYMFKFALLGVFRRVYDQYDKIIDQDDFLLHNQILLENLVHISNVNHPQLVYKVLNKSHKARY